MKHILDPTFRYTSSIDTDLRKTFARVRREQREALARQRAEEQEQAEKVRPLPQIKSKGTT